ncbi:16S rRNA (guanine(966)-N(2))-methyltransferase RsmD [bacterium]|nr:16S rRNA (guanine(966)-N(2))-methyltransferase RsmD [bacterium]
MRIIAGIYKGRSLITPPDSRIRPTTDRVKQRLFDCLGIPFDFEHVLDLFAGTGNLGLEALSRGADDVTFVDSSRIARKIIEQNCSKVAVSDKVHVLPGEVFRVIQRLRQAGKQFDLIFADPPYAQLLATRLLQTIVNSGILTENGVFALEYASHDSADPDLLPVSLLNQKVCGETTFSIYQLQ